MDYHYAVVTRVPKHDSDDAWGNCASALGGGLRVQEGATPMESSPLRADMALGLLMPVFYTGEIVVLDDNGREPLGRFRCPSKWDVTVESFDTIEEAVARSIEVSAL